MIDIYNTIITAYLKECRPAFDVNISNYAKCKQFISGFILLLIRTSSSCA